ncbi:hypothetical protein E2C01_023387 [Portunus trituberculatus]|uniref:Uncharacterized protein n=1 Tax=Portunus trituberculatus TaxID=210409 RepID=A0A5B7E9N2_PORTR|nr:hypothetical protein [Portunus trituberculatus]
MITGRRERENTTTSASATNLRLLQDVVTGPWQVFLRAREAKWLEWCCSVPPTRTHNRSFSLQDLEQGQDTHYLLSCLATTHPAYHEASPRPSHTSISVLVINEHGIAEYFDECGGGSIICWWKINCLAGLKMLCSFFLQHPCSPQSGPLSPFPTHNMPSSAT